MRVGPWRKLRVEKRCYWTVVLEKILESPLDCKEIKPVNPRGNWPWIFLGRTDAEAETLKLSPCCKEPTHWKRPWCWETLKAGGERDDRGWDGWTASVTQWTWVWANSGSWWWTGKPDVLQSIRSHDWVTELNLMPMIYEVQRLYNKLWYLIRKFLFTTLFKNVLGNS